MTRIPRVRTAALLFALTVAVTISLLFPARLSIARQDAASAPVEVGAGPIREQSLGLIGHNIYQTDTVDLFGYLTRVIGLDPGLLFTNSAASERTARFTYSGSVQISPRSNRGDVTAFDGTGVIRVYLDNDAGASWDDPASFADGQPVAELSIRLRDTLHRQAPGVGVLVGDGELSQATATDFAIDGEQYRFGNSGIEQRLQYVGALLPESADSPSIAVSLSGTAHVVAREAIPVNVGQPPATAVAAAPSRDCPDLQPWLDQSVANLNRTSELAAVVSADDDIASLDENAVRQAASETAALGEAQRQLDAPETASEANRLVVTALSTFARGLEVIASAVAQEDTDLLAQGQSVVADGRQLLERAIDEVTALSDTC